MVHACILSDSKAVASCLTFGAACTLSKNTASITAYSADLNEMPHGSALYLGDTRPEEKNFFHTELSMLRNVKMPTIVGILTFISMIDTTSERLKARNFFINRDSVF